MAGGVFGSGCAGGIGGRIFFKRGDQLYELRYAAPEEDYEGWPGVFRALVRSFAFLEELEWSSGLTFLESCAIIELIRGAVL